MNPSTFWTFSLTFTFTFSFTFYSRNQKVSVWYQNLLSVVISMNTALTMPSCAICSFEVPTDKDLKSHLQVKHDDRELTCQQCKKICKGGINLNTHMNSQREVKCKQCDQTIPYNSTSSHMKKCVSRERDFKCENCPAVFNTEWNLKVHVTNKSCPVKCNRCDKTLKNGGYLDRHMASVHSVQMQVVKTSEGHIGLFQSEQVQNVFKSACVLTMVAFVKKTFFSPQVSFESAFVVALIAFLKKRFLWVLMFLSKVYL